MTTLAVIPVRYESRRFPGKALADLGGKPVLQWVYEGAGQARTVDEVLVATDDERIQAAAEGFGAPCVRTGSTPRNGSERVAEAVRDLDAEVVVNVQGDEVLVTGAAVDAAVDALRQDPDAVLATLAVPLAGPELLADPNAVKVVADAAGRALYFSRAAVPHVRPGGAEEAPRLLHVGVYAFRYDFLQAYPRLARTPLERAEGLEQLRVLEHGHPIRLAVIADDLRAVNASGDLEAADRLLRARGLL